MDQPPRKKFRPESATVIELDDSSDEDRTGGGMRTADWRSSGGGIGCVQQQSVDTRDDMSLALALQLQDEQDYQAAAASAAARTSSDGAEMVEAKAKDDAKSAALAKQLHDEDRNLGAAAGGAGSAGSVTSPGEGAGLAHQLHEQERQQRDFQSALQLCNGDGEQARRLLCEPLELGALNRLNASQRAALHHVACEAQRACESVLPQLESKFARHGFPSGHLERTLRYIRDSAPIIIHVDCAKVLPFLESDSHYRNLFETSTSGGTADTVLRAQWEDRLFNRAYQGSAAHDRVKYGVLNVVQDAAGVRACAQYGTSFLVLKEVRLRTTFSDQDTSNVAGVVASCQYYAHVLDKYNEQELRAVVDVACGSRPFGCATPASGSIGNYKEVQVHGPIRLDRHVDCIYVSAADAGVAGARSRLQRVCEKHGFNVIYMDELQ